MKYLFSSESVAEGHPDKVCDLISDAVLDEALSQDKRSRVAIETFVSTNYVLVGGEMTTKADIDVEMLVRNTLKEIGYTNSDYGIDADTCIIDVKIKQQSLDIAQGVDDDHGLFKEQGAGDQGIMFGYACNQTEEYLPLPIVLANKIVRELAKVRRSGELKYLRPDGKAQVTVEYEDKVPIKINSVVVSNQHAPEISHDLIYTDIVKKVIKRVIPDKLLDSETKFWVNPTGRFVIGGPEGDTGLTGRKVVIDTYGGWARHGGGAFSGKDPSKVDRSGAYMARYVAKNLVASGLADEAEVQLAYAIGVARPVSVFIDSHGTGKLNDQKLAEIVEKLFDLTPAGIIKKFDLLRPIYKQIACYGHFGRMDLDLAWEKIDKVEDLKKLAGKSLITV